MKRDPRTGKFLVRWRENGRHRSRSYTLKADAERFKRDVERAKEIGRPLEIDRGKETMAEFVEIYWRRYAVPSLAANTLDGYGQVWERHLRQPLGGLRLREVTPAVVADLKARMISAGVGLATVHKALSLLSGMFRQAVLWDYVDRNPVADVRVPISARAGHVDPLSPSLVEALRLELLSQECVTDAMLVAVLAYSGLRPQEARALRWGDVGQRTLRISRAVAGSEVKTTKTGKIRTVDLLRPVAMDLRLLRAHQSWPADDELVFPTARGGIWTDSDYRNWRRRVFRPAAEAVGFTGRVYDLRHSFASLLFHEGRSSIEVALQLGNSPHIASDTYGHVFADITPEARHSASDAIEAARSEFGVREMYVALGLAVEADAPDAASQLEADAGTRTPDPIITSSGRTSAQ